MTKIKWNEFSLQFRAVSSHWCDVTRDQDCFALDIATIALHPAVKDLHLDLLFDRTVGNAPAGPPSPGLQPRGPKAPGRWRLCCPWLPVLLHYSRSQLLSSCRAVSACAVRGEQHGFPLIAGEEPAAWKREQWPWQNRSVAGWLTDPLAKTLERGEGTLGGAGGGRRGGESQHMCTAEVTKTADLGRAGGTHREERNGRDAKGTVQN